jgi:type IV pilus assembly protein PilV
MREELNVGRHGGSVLIEAMVAVLVFSFGILALVSMQTAAIRSTADAKYRSDASFLANQIVGQMWGVPSSDLEDYASGSSATAADASTCPEGVASETEAVISWLEEVERLLPGAEQDKQQITVVGDVVTVRVCWSDKSAAPGVYHNHVISAQINKNS